MKLDIEISQFNGPVDWPTWEVGLLEDLSQLAVGADLDGVSLEVQSQSSGESDQSKG